MTRFAQLSTPSRRARTTAALRDTVATVQEARHVRPSRGGSRLLLLLAAALAVLALGTGSAEAATPGSGWAISSLPQPTNFAVADNANCQNASPVDGATDCDIYEVVATDVGSQAMDGSDITLTDTVPDGLTVEDVSLYDSGLGANDTLDLGPLLCTTSPVQCTIPSDYSSLLPIDPDTTLTMYVVVTVNDSTSATVTNTATVSGGGGAPPASASSQNTVNSTATPVFGAHAFSNSIVGVDGQPDTQAGGHPYELNTLIDLNNEFKTTPEGPIAGPSGPTSVEDPKDVVVDLPLGFMGSAVSAPQCTFAQLAGSGCPPDTQVGHILSEPFWNTIDGVDSAIYNMVPERGVVAEFGYVDSVDGSHAMYASVVPTSSGYVLQVKSADIPQIPITGVLVTFFGDPAARDGSGNTPSAMLTNPTDCDGQPLTFTAYMDSWQNPGSFNPDGTPDLSDPAWKTMSSSSPPVTGCNALSFQPTFSAQPDTTVADSPSGLNVDISLPQSENPNTLATPPLDDASVTLPPGFTVNPSSAAGLEACTPAQIALSSAAAPTCPQASQIGTVQLQTPLLPGTLQGEIYLASEFDNPFDSLLAGYIVVDDPATGVVIKIPGNLTPNATTGQITGVFDNNPQFPFSDLKLDFKGGPTGVLATPESCGTFTTNSVFSAWSFPDSGPAATPSDSFSIDSGCVSGFNPSFTAGVEKVQAGAYSPFVLSISRSDQDQNFQGLSVTLPPGMLAKLAGVQECSEAQLASISSQPGTAASQIANPSCPSGSQVGTVTTGAGTGPDPFFLNGKVYLTGPYKGAPYGLAVVVPVLAGPLDLGTVVVRQALYVNPATAQVTDVSDDFPTILDGIPLRIRRVDVVLNRPDFTVNPTSCDPMAVTGTATSIQGTKASLNSRFQVGGCASLGFSPKLKMKLSGKGQTRSTDHPTLTSVLTQKSGQANIHNVRVALPLNFALDPNNSQIVCPYSIASKVTTGPADCPASTQVGTATAVTPLLSKPLTGPVYLVQGLSFSGGVETHTLPTLLIPLRGQIALDLRAQTSVTHSGKLVTTFPTIPDAAVSRFTLTINGGKKGILEITGRGRNICTGPQVTDATLVAQSGKAEYPSVKMGTPCRAARHKTKKRRKHSARHGARSR